MNPIINVSLRQKAIYIPDLALKGNGKTLSSTTSVLVANLARLGFGVSEKLLGALNRTTPVFQANLLEQFRGVMGVNKNWTPLVKGWDKPTGESFTDVMVTFFANIFGVDGTALPCGCIIPENTFPLERYNGCPFCGTPFEVGELELHEQGSKQRILELWSDEDALNFLKDLLASKTALDATQMSSLKILLKELPLPDVPIEMKETLMAVIDILVEAEMPEKAQVYFKNPNDILRYLWYKQTGFLQIVEPKTIINRKKLNAKAVYLFKSKKKINNEMEAGRAAAKEELKLKYSRNKCKMVAHWLNDLKIQATQACEIMHPRRGMWVRFIRALRLPEYAKKAGFENLKSLLDIFYREDYAVWQGRLDGFRLNNDIDGALSMLKQRPGLFARSLFSNMLWFGREKVTEAFSQVIEKVPARLLFTLSSMSENYFDPEGVRTVKPLGGVRKHIPKNKVLKLYTKEQLEAMKESIEDLCLLAMEKRFGAIETENKTIYIDPMLYKIPVSIGERSETVQDLPAALMGSRFAVEGDVVRLFMQWGEGLSAQHLDMDLSCHIAYEKRNDYCSYSNLSPMGCKHSGDIQRIPEKVGTAEYIDVNVKKLAKKGAKYVTFTCNAYSSGSITPNVVVGWMDSKYPMKISEKTGVAYDPSCVQHQVRVTQGLAKGLVFGVLELESREIIWLEMSFQGQIVQNLIMEGVKALLKKLDSRLSIGNLLAIKAKAQKLELSEESEGADEVYDQEWALNTAAVTQLLVD